MEQTRFHHYCLLTCLIFFSDLLRYVIVKEKKRGYLGHHSSPKPIMLLDMYINTLLKGWVPCVLNKFCRISGGKEGIVVKGSMLGCLEDLSLWEDTLKKVIVMD